MRLLFTTFLVLIGSFCAAGQTTINLSHDLVQLGIATQNLVPNVPTQDAQPLLTAAIGYAQNKGGVQELTVDTGDYYFLTAQNDILYIFLGIVSNLTLDFKGSHLYFKNGMIRAFELDYCQHVTLENFTIDSLEPRYTQVTLTSIDATNLVFTYSVPAGWPDPATFTSTVFGTPQLFVTFFRNGTQVAATSRNFVNYPITSPQFVLTSNGEPWTQPDVLGTLRPGDVAAITDRSGWQAISVDSGDFITLSNIEIHGSGGGFAVQVGRSSNSVADNVRIKPRAGGLIGSNADGIHFTDSLNNNHIRHCYVTGTMDDALGLDADFVASVVSQPSSRVLNAQRHYNYRLSNGSMMNFVHLSDGTEVGGGVVVSQNPADSSSVVSGAPMTITFDRDLPTLAVGDEIVFAAADMRSAGSSIEDNLVETIPYGRGIYLGGIENVDILRNVIRGTSNAGINVSEVTVAAGGGGLPAHGIKIQDNVIEDVLGPQASGAGAAYVNQAAIVVSSNDPNFDFVTMPVNSNIQIRSNFISGSGRAGIWVGELSGGSVSDNVVVRWDQYPNLPVWVGNPYPGDFAQPLVVRFSSNVQTVGNLFEAGARLNGPVTLYPAEVAAKAIASSGYFVVHTSVRNFGWTAVSDSPWIVVYDGGVHQNNGLVMYTIAASTNSGPRTGHIKVAGVSFTITQGGS